MPLSNRGCVNSILKWRTFQKQVACPIVDAVWLYVPGRNIIQPKTSRPRRYINHAHKTSRLFLTRQYVGREDDCIILSLLTFAKAQQSRIAEGMEIVSGD
jgi:hypothetical protein